MATYAIGDLQGCCNAFDRLLAEIGFSPSRDSLHVVGDLVNRGPASLRTLQSYVTRAEQRGGSNQVLEALLGCKPTGREDHEGVIPDAELRADLSRSP